MIKPYLGKWLTVSGKFDKANNPWYPNLEPGDGVIIKTGPFRRYRVTVSYKEAWVDCGGTAQGNPVDHYRGDSGGFSKRRWCWKSASHGNSPHTSRASGYRAGLDLRTVSSVVEPQEAPSTAGSAGRFTLSPHTGQYGFCLVCASPKTGRNETDEAEPRKYIGSKHSVPCLKCALVVETSAHIWSTGVLAIEGRAAAKGHSARVDAPRTSGEPDCQDEK
jgi:hypothetical protein